MNTGEPGSPGGAGARDEAGGRAPRPNTRAKGRELDHVAIALRSFDGVLPLLERLGGVAATPPERVESQGVEVCFVGSVELIRPLVGDNGVARFIDRRGPGLHHIAYRVADVGALMKELGAEGYRFTSEAPMTGAGGHRIAFMHPKSTGGVLVELVEAH
ncbi:MAG: VOC family protein [Gemmatimonadetes bacterium]|nr:VOC family protein [Gemmatimonadota bacterium]MYH51818.1 VOC family protein [Gemmatimonadota bacterium]